MATIGKITPDDTCDFLVKVVEFEETEIEIWHLKIKIEALVKFKNEKLVNLNEKIVKIWQQFSDVWNF